ncbi:MAG TPA: SPOR domain-containing protein [Candidatus Sulfotelmatobacter sp.]|nr:SPOR domain-containing protein [Candidatus Sulfotelmatobacter sp.]
MASSQDTEITLGTGKLLVLFFGLVGICAVFFALGYSLGRKSEPTIASASTMPMPQASSNSNKASGASTAAAPPMTFYKAAEQKDATPELTPRPDTKSDTPADPNAPAANATPAQAPASSGADPSTTIPSAGYFVQVAAVSKQEDADALVDALKKKDYPAFVASAATTDKLFRVQLGPFSDIKDAEAMRTRLTADGYSPIVKK